jgi:dihydrofolate synthase / folylpolyglutamate synthase
LFVRRGQSQAESKAFPMTYTDAIRFLYDLQLFGTKLGLENTQRLAALAGDPHTRLRFIHVAGTNGKGSTCAMLESIYRASGVRVGLFTSPHLVSFRERIQVDRVPIGEDDVVRQVRELRALLAAFPHDHSPTFFELVTVMALRHFVERRCDLVIWETGMGGRLDATNIVTPLASVITNIAFDHQQWLGDTLARIAAEKAGIIKPGVLVVTATDAPEALAVIRAAAAMANAPLVAVGLPDAGRPPLDAIELPLLGEHQRLNAALALAVVRELQPQMPVADVAVHEGLAGVRWAGRLQVLRAPEGPVTLLDGAHNSAGALALAAALARHFPGRKPALILGVLRDKDWQAVCRALAPLADPIILVPVASKRTATPEELFAACTAGHPGVRLTVCHTLAEALALTAAEPFRLIAGSLYLVGEAIVLLVGANHGLDERALNEWGTTSPR